MAFQYPQFLYALFLLIIPILIHLFQLRKFQKIEFTNVSLLRKIRIQSRKSAKLKKYLVLISRLFAFTALIFAFAKPYVPNQLEQDQEVEYVIYLDNSFSMEFQNGSKTLFEDAKQELLKFLPEDEEVVVFTNSEVYRNKQNLKNDILSSKHISSNLSLTQVLLKSNSFFTASEQTRKELILLSDFQDVEPEIINFQEYLSKNQNLNFVQLQPEQPINSSIHSINYQERQNQIELDVELQTYGANNQLIDVSLFDDDQLVAKKQVEFQDQNSVVLKFQLVNKAYPKSRIEIEANGLHYDNTLYFSINENTKLNVLSINQESDDFLRRIYNTANFNYSSFTLDNLDYSVVNQSDVIVINEVEEFSNNFINSLQNYLDDGGQLVIIPSSNSVQSLNKLLGAINLQTLGKQSKSKIQLTKINFQHPIYQNTFVDEIDNFDYPSFKNVYQFPNNASYPLYFSNNSPLLVSNNNVHVFTAPLNSESSNFQNSPLIVPTFYNLAQLNRLENQLSFEVNQANSIKIDWESTSDDVIQLVNREGEKFIPQQRKQLKYVEINTAEVPKEAGHYAVVAQQDTLKYLSFNYNRNQSVLNYYPFNNEDNLYSSIAGLFDDLRKQQEIKSFWYWFLIFALIFLLVEVLLLKYFKN